MNISKIKSQEALEDIRKHPAWTMAAIHGMNEVDPELVKAFNIVEKDLEHLQKLQSMTHLLYSGRKKLVNEYGNWCEKNCVLKDDLVNYTTWLLNIKLREVLED